MKFKNIKKKVYEKEKSPSNSRSISEQIDFLKLGSWVLKFFVFLVFAIAIIVIGYDLQRNIQMKEIVDSKRDNLMKNLYFWESFIATHKDYADAYFQVAILEYRLGDVLKAREYLEKGLVVNPSSVDGRKLERFFGSK